MTLLREEASLVDMAWLFAGYPTMKGKEGTAAAAASAVEGTQLAQTSVFTIVIQFQDDTMCNHKRYNTWYRVMDHSMASVAPRRFVLLDVPGTHDDCINIPVSGDFSALGDMQDMFQSLWRDPLPNHCERLRIPLQLRARAAVTAA